jgi:hypothetical protein
MSNLTDLAAEIVVQLELLVAAGTVISLTNQQDADASVDATLLLATANHAARHVRRKLGDVDETDDDAVDFGVRLALLRMIAVYSCTLTEGGAAYTSGVIRELEDEAEARRQAVDSFEMVEEDHADLDLRYPETTWDSTD